MTPPDTDLPPTFPALSKADNTLSLPPGHRIHEYTIQNTLGGGGFGITYLARDANLDLPVAIKEYLPGDLAGRGQDHSVNPISSKSQELFAQGLERFLDEARTLATFRHPNIIRVLRYFKANGTAYIVMEYESGESLKQWLPRHTPIDRSGLLNVIHPLLDGLAMVHQSGFLHRDIKPDNIYIRRDGSPVLLDFGAARRVVADRDLTTIISPGFAPFEQYHTQGNQGPWSDLYSLAAVMYWMISGEKPVEAAARLRQDKMKPAVEIDRHNLFGRTLLEAIDWAMDPEESRRPQTVVEFRKRLQDSVGEDATIRVSPQQDMPTIRVNNAPADNTKLGASGPSDSRRNMVCTILFLDIVAYSTKSVDEQFSMKSAFNQMIAGKLAHIPDAARVTLDTGDGAAVCFMGDPEDVLHASIDIQRSLVENKNMQLRIGLHIGPIRLLTDLNGRDNVIGDGINVAQRVMSFAGINQIVVSRSYYDIVACLSDNGASRFSHIGEHRDKHDRAHDLYAVVAEHGADAEPVRTVQLNPQEPVPTHIDGETLAALTRELTRLIGPLAPALVRKAAGRVKNVEEMRELLSQSLSDPAQRQTFLAGTANTLTVRGGHSMPEDTAAAAHHPPSSPSTPSGSPSTTPSLRPWLDDATSKLLEKHLTQAIGPVARIVMKNEIRKASDLKGLCQALAAQIDNAEARAVFLKAVGR